MSERRDVAEDLVEAVRKEAVGEVAKGVVKGVKAALFAALAAICALVWSLWTANPVATVALAVVSLAFGTAVGAAAGWRRAVSAKDAEITELKKRPTQEDVDELRRQLAAKDAEIESLETELAGRPTQEDVDERDAEIESLRSPVESVRRAIASLPEDERALAGRLAEGPFRTSGFSAGLAHLESMGIAKKQRVAGVFTPTWALTREAMSALAEDDGLRATVADALGKGLRDREAEESIASVIRRASAATAGAISFMFDEGHFDYRAPDDDPWEARMDQGNRELSEVESYGVIQYETLASGKRRWTLTENARKAIESDESLIGEGRAYVRAALEDGANKDAEGV